MSEGMCLEAPDCWRSGRDSNPRRTDVIHANARLQATHPTNRRPPDRYAWLGAALPIFDRSNKELASSRIIAIYIN